MEYEYSTIDVAVEDMGNWHVQDARKFGLRMTVRSTVLLSPTPIEIPLQHTKYATVVAGEGTVQIVRSALLRCFNPDPHDFHYWELKKTADVGMPSGTYICAVEVGQ
jgi:hypothetical protein